MGNLKLSDIVKELPFKTHNVNLFWNVYSIIKDNRAIDFDVFLPTKGMNLQRPFCWTLEQKQQLIISLLKGIYVPKLAILVAANDNKNHVYQIIDGKQRLNAMLSFMRDEFPIVFECREYLFSQCEKEIQFAIKTYSPQCEVAYFYDDDPISDDAKVQWFQQINFAGTPQDTEHLNHLLNS